MWGDVKQELAMNSEVDDVFVPTPACDGISEEVYHRSYLISGNTVCYKGVRCLYCMPELSIDTNTTVVI